MAGHSKWKNIQHRKVKQDAAKGQRFTKISREIYAAVRQGGGNPESNFRLKTAIEKARSINMPMDNIQRTIDKALGNVEGTHYEALVYEGYGPGGTAILLELLTDNRNRTAAEIRHIFSKRGGSLGETGCVAWMFDRKGQLWIDAAGVSEDDVILTALEAGAEDVRSGEEQYEVLTAPEDFQTVKEALEKAGLRILDAGVTYLPRNVIALSGEEADKAMALVDALEEHDDVQNVYANFDVPEES